MNYAYLDKVGMLHITKEKSTDDPNRVYVETGIDCYGGYPYVAIAEGGQTKAELYMESLDKAKINGNTLNRTHIRGRYPEVWLLYQRLAEMK